MNNQGEEHQSLDIGLLRYSPDDIGIRHASDAVPNKITKTPKDVLVEESNPADIYLYDHTEENSRQSAHERSAKAQQSLTATTSNYGDDKNTASYINDTSNHMNSINDSNNESPQDIDYSNSNNSNMDSQSALTLLKQRDRHDYREEHRQQQDLVLDKGLDKGPLVTPSQEPSIPASQEMQSADTLLTRTSFDTREGNEGNDSSEQPFYVNAKQYYRILKRRYTRAKLEENLRISRERRPYLHESRHKHAMRRPRGQGGRFLTLAEIEAMKSKEGSVSSGSSASSPPNIKSEGEHMASGPRLIEKQGPKPKKLKPADGSNR
ncbi:hypothetical protein ZYGR_0AN01200 [Zygosaccharomyces rouxii]|uniref:Transcriptional activator HAP2 n=1 Tax=Zygosaccharomyces rouxii TaxID=4956 RepID=A0A1Q3AG54_ZYGRO|nr:hypothetical protein ZYGR_0AN01200 [Zygosaccharomyces rouxii]